MSFSNSKLERHLGEGGDVAAAYLRGPEAEAIERLEHRSTELRIRRRDDLRGFAVYPAGRVDGESHDDGPFDPQGA